MKHKFGLLPKVLLAIALGIVFGLFVPEWFTRIALTFNNIFGNFLNFVIPLLILGLVAPGIAEALLATAIGLVAAIPAVVIYNVFARAITGYRQNLGDVGAGVERLVSRDLDFRGLPAARARAAE